MAMIMENMGDGSLSKIDMVADWIMDAKRVSALTGAGISVDSGIPDFRSKGGLWSRYDPAEYASVHNFIQDPAKVWNMFNEIIDLCEAASPNPAHYALAELEALGKLEGIITQNVDYLHQRAGCKNVIEIHGNNKRLRCRECSEMFKLEKRAEETPPRCDCGGYLRPDVVLFDEAISPRSLIRSRDLASGSDLMLIIGTSALVAPASYMPFMTKTNGGRIVEFNLELTQMTPDVDICVIGKASRTLPSLVEAVRDRQEWEMGSKV